VFWTDLPQAVHLEFSKNCGFPHRAFGHGTMSDPPQASHFSLPAKVWPPQDGQGTINFLPHPEQRSFPRCIGFRQDGQ